MLWLLFLTIICVSLQIDGGSEFAVALPSGADFNADFLTNVLALIGQIFTFRISGFGGLLTTLLFVLPTIPIAIWLLVLLVDAVIKLVGAITPF